MFPTSNEPPPPRPAALVLHDEYCRLADLACGSARATAGRAPLCLREGSSFRRSGPDGARAVKLLSIED
jgi:hypothetical protein